MPCKEASGGRAGFQPDCRAQSSNVYRKSLRPSIALRLESVFLIIVLFFVGSNPLNIIFCWHRVYFVVDDSNNSVLLCQCTLAFSHN